jgi:hypothetical protein
MSARSTKSSGEPLRLQSGSEQYSGPSSFPQGKPQRHELRLRRLELAVEMKGKGFRGLLIDPRQSLDSGWPPADRRPGLPGGEALAFGENQRGQLRWRDVSGTSYLA